MRSLSLKCSCESISSLLPNYTLNYKTVLLWMTTNRKKTMNSEQETTSTYFPKIHNNSQKIKKKKGEICRELWSPIKKIKPLKRKACILAPSATLRDYQCPVMMKTLSGWYGTRVGVIESAYCSQGIRRTRAREIEAFKSWHVPRRKTNTLWSWSASRYLKTTWYAIVHMARCSVTSLANKIRKCSTTRALSIGCLSAIIFTIFSPATWWWVWQSVRGFANI